MTTVAPAAMQACACAFCLSGSLRALLIDAVTPAFLKAAFMSGASNCTQRTDDFVSGSRTQTCTLAVFFLVLARGGRHDEHGEAGGRKRDERGPSTCEKPFFKMVSLVALTGGQYSSSSPNFALQVKL